MSKVKSLNNSKITQKDHPLNIIKLHTPIHIVLLYCLIIFVASRLVFFYEYQFLAEYVFKLGDIFFIDVWTHWWDNFWYRNIINLGYDQRLINSSGQAPWAFFPVFPLIIKILLIFDIPVNLTGVLFNQLILFLSMIVLYRYCEKFASNVDPHYAIAFLAFSLENLYFFSLYTEALFIFISLLAFYNLRQQKYWQAAIYAGILSGIKFFGIFMVITILFSRVYNKNFQLKKEWLTILFQLLLSMSGLLLFMLYLNSHLGDPFAFYKAQKAWAPATSIIGFIFSPLAYLERFFASGNLYTFGTFFLAIATIVFLGIKKLYEEMLFIFLCILTPLMQARLFANQRFVLSLFPIYLFLGFISRQNKLAGIILFTIFVVSNFAFCFFWLSGSDIVT